MEHNGPNIPLFHYSNCERSELSSQVMMIETLSTDVLIVGAGAAGIRAAISARQGEADVIMVAAEDVTHGGSTFSKISNGWGIQALVGRERTPENLETFYNDIIRVGLDQSDPKLARILVEESGPAIEDLMSYGLEFKKDANGKHIRARGCFSEFERAFLTDNIDNIRWTFRTILKRFAVRFVAGCTTDLIMEDGACRGAWIMSKSGECSTDQRQIHHSGNRRRRRHLS